MKSEEQIRHALAQLDAFLAVADPTSDKTEIAYRKAQKKAVEWILSDIPSEPIYYCMACHISHKDPKCPKCGSDNVAPPEPEQQITEEK